MVIKSIDAKMLQKMFLAGANSIEAKKEYINELNVFPVPDGDTGTNMSLTIMAAAREVAKIQDPNFINVTKAISTGSLRGARGNSGVILSQIFRGLCKEISTAKKEVRAKLLAKAFEAAVHTAYGAVMKPKEGTILTVARAGADAALEAAFHDKIDDINELLQRVIEDMQTALDNTPELLPVLKQAGVVDSGGQGLLEIIKGAYYALIGKELDLEVPQLQGTPVVQNTDEEVDLSDIKFGYCTEFIVLLEKKYNQEIENEFKKTLMDMGDSVVVVSDDGIVKVHVHTNHPGQAIEKGLTLGSLTSMKIDNMREEHQEKLIKDAEKKAEMQSQEFQAEEKEFGMIAVSAGEGLNKSFKELGVDYIIEGGQTMNPSTEDMLNAIKKINARNIFILPNNSNIILAASQAKELVEDKNIIVIPTKTVPQGITAAFNLSLDKSAEENEKRLNESIHLVKTGQVTYSVRDTNIDGKDICKDDIMGMADGKMLAVGKAILPTTKELISEMVDDESELITIYYGSDMEEDSVNEFAEEIEELYEDCDVEVYYGGQPVYYFFIGVE